MPKKISKKTNKKTKKSSVKRDKVSIGKRYFWWFIIFLSILIIGVIIFLIYFFNRPVSGTVAVMEEKKATSPANMPFERFETKHLSFRHTGAFLEKSHQTEPDAANVVLESAFFSENAANSKKFALTVENLAGRTMEDSGNYNFRARNPEKYQKEKFALDDLSGISFSSDGDGLFEKTFFIPRENFLVVLSFSSPKQADEQWNAEIEDVLRSIQWKK